jgi:hypothetical protein
VSGGPPDTSTEDTKASAGRRRPHARGVCSPPSITALNAFAALLLTAWLPLDAFAAPARRTTVAIVGDAFHLNGQPTYAGRSWRGHKIEGLLLNSRMVQGVFDDRNPDTAHRWAYPDTGQWDAERNTREFLEAMPEWRRHGLLAFTLNLQGGSPQGYSAAQPWHNSAIEADGSLRPDYMARLARILDRADELGMVVILGYFYFGQDERLRDEAAVVRAVDHATQWLFNHGYRNALVEINNECNVRYDHAILRPERVHELIDRVKRTERDGRRLLVGTSYGGGTIPKENVVRASDFLLLHGNGVAQPARIAAMVRQTRAVPGYTTKPIVFNEDDHFDFDRPTNHFTAAISEYASWGYFDFRMKGEGFDEGYQSVPVNWGLSSARKRGFFTLLAEMTGSPAPATAPARPPAPGHVEVSRTNYHGWADSLRMHNGQAEVIVVPAIGRVMQFGFAGEEGVFWENRALDGQPADATDWATKDWVNFGGDKTWPAPEGDWPKLTGRKTWRPPPAFDALPVQARVEGSDVVLTSPVDPFLGVRTERRVHLQPDAARLLITTTYERVRGEPTKLSVWVITQLQEPLGLYAPLPVPSRFEKGFVTLGKDLPPDLKVERGLISLTRNPRAAHKIGTDAGTLLWVGEKAALRIDSLRVTDAEYPDHGSSAEIYTNPDPLKYIELETLGPLHLMKPGDRIQQVNTYTLSRRTESSPEAEARKLIGR